MPSNHGLVGTVLAAYCLHHNLVLRPDDFWVAIMTQFSFYVTANAEALRDKLVDFEGKKELTIYGDGELFTCNFGKVSTAMVDNQIAKNIKDPEIAAWAIPNFSTTKEEDRIVCAISLMSSLQNFFKYKCALECGIPNVTLLGTLDDWKELRKRVDKILEFQVPNVEHLDTWVCFLQKVTDNLVFNYENPNHPDTLKFWDNVAEDDSGGSGPSYTNGWIGVFSSWTAKGEWQGICEMEEYAFSSNKIPTEWPVLDTEDLTVGIVSVPLLVDDNGCEYHCHMFAGQLGYEVIDDENKDTIYSRSDW